MTSQRDYDTILDLTSENEHLSNLLANMQATMLHTADRIDEIALVVSRSANCEKLQNIAKILRNGVVGGGEENFYTK